MDFKAYLKGIGAKVGDKLEFVDYTEDRNHTHWGFHNEDSCYWDFYVGADGYMHSNTPDGDTTHHTNWGFIFKLKEKTEKTSRPIWCGKLFGKMNEAEKGAFLVDILAGKQAFFGSRGHTVDGPEDGGYTTVVGYVERFERARAPQYRYYSSRALLEEGKQVLEKATKLEREIADLKRKQEEKEKELAKLLS